MQDGTSGRAAQAPRLLTEAQISAYCLGVKHTDAHAPAVRPMFDAPLVDIYPASRVRVRRRAPSLSDVQPTAFNAAIGPSNTTRNSLGLFHHQRPIPKMPKALLCDKLAAQLSTHERPRLEAAQRLPPADPTDTLKLVLSPPPIYESQCVARDCHR